MPKLMQQHFDQQFDESVFTRDFKAHLRTECENFFIKGILEQSKNIRPVVDTLEVNLSNSKLSDKEFRELADSIVKRLREVL